MKTQTIEIVDRGRGPQLSTTRITVLDIFYYLHRGYQFETIHEVMPTLLRAEFDVVLDYVNRHREELIDADRKAEEFVREQMAKQHARGGIFAESDANLTTDERVARLRKLMKQRIPGTTGERHSG